MKRKLALLLLWIFLLLPGQALAESVYESDMILINKQYGLPSDYVPSDLSYPDVAYADNVAESRKQLREDAARALEEMFAAALEDGIELLAISGYRSYWTQRTIYERRLAEMGPEHVAKYNAEPGHSEHQTGLAMDVGCPGYTDLMEDFAETPAYYWLQQHAHEYGFIVRYTRYGETETGYAFEPWHVRYIGDEAPAVWESGLTLEVYVQRKLNSASVTATLPRLYPAGE